MGIKYFSMGIKILIKNIMDKLIFFKKIYNIENKGLLWVVY